MPWKHTCNAFNMKTPDLWLAPEDLEDLEVLEMLRQSRVVGCYCFCPLEDYSVLRHFPHIWDLQIHKGQQLKDLRFMENMGEWFQLYIEDAQLEDLKPAFPGNWREKGLHSYCVGFVGCRIRDISALLREDIRLNELVICQPEGTCEKDRWKSVRASSYQYYEYKE